MGRRKIEENIFKGFMITSTIIILFTILFILITVIIKGLPAMNLAMITQVPKGGYYLGKEGGILNAIIGSLYLGLGATFLSILISLPVVMYFNVYARKDSHLVSFVRFSLDILWGVPSIVYGAFGFIIMLFFGLNTSLLGGIITIALLIMPIMTRAMDEVVRMVPRQLMEASYALGATKLETAFKIVTRQTLPGLLTAVLVAFGRGIGDAAAVIFTAGFSDNIPYSLFQPAATLPLAIFYQLGTPFPEVQERAYASSFILMVIILIISVLSRIIGKKLSRNIVK